MWFSKDNYRAYYDAMGELEEIELIYSFTVAKASQAQPQSERLIAAVLIDTSLRVRRDEIKETITSEKPSFENTNQALAFSVNKTRTLTNSLGFIPAVESFNNMRSTGMDATGEFDWLAEQIVTHDDLVKNIRPTFTLWQPDVGL